MVVVNGRGGKVKVNVKAKPIPTSTTTAKLKAKVKEKDKVTPTSKGNKKEKNGKELAEVGGKTRAKTKDSTTTSSSDNKSNNCNKPTLKKKKNEISSPLPAKKVKDKVIKVNKTVKSTEVTNIKAKAKIVDSPKTKEKGGKEKGKLKSRSSSPSSTKSGNSATVLNSKKKVPVPQTNSKQSPVINSKIIRPDNPNVVTNGPRIQAQRKFAQAGNICMGAINFNPSVIPANSPYATPSKEITPCKRSHEGANNNGSSSSAKKVKKPMFSPPPCKRPKTEDFLTFLCVRGTSALPPEFDFFKYPQVLEPETQVPPQKKKIFAQTATQSTSMTEIKVKPLNILNSGLSSTSSNKINGKNKQLVSKAIKVQDKQLPVHSGKTAVGIPESEKKSTSSSISSSFTSSSCNPVCKAENPTKGIRATASSVLFSKLRKTSSPVTRTRPILSPPRSRLNEQDARFAMTALKLKYQRLAVNKSNRSAILTKKAKESIILTRSKSRTSFTQGKLSPKRGKLVPRTMKPIVISPSRNAPSPDIIFGVISSASAARKRAVKSSSDEESEVEEEDTKKNKSSEAESSEESQDSASEEEEEDSAKVNNASSNNEPLTRSLRNGKELARAKSRSPRPEKKNSSTADKTKEKRSQSNSPDNRRVGTRSAHRLTKSPLREIPMYKDKDHEPTKKLKSKKKLQKKIVKDENSDNEKPNGSKKKDNSKDTPSKKKMDKTDDGKRPTRKTKETATNLLNLLNHGFSTDEDSSKEKDAAKEEDSEVGSSSSSEAHYLEKHYNAAMRREEEKFMKNKKSKSEMQRRSSTRRESVNSASSNKVNQKNTKAERKLRSKTRETSSSSNEDDNDEEKQVHKKKSKGSSVSATKSSRNSRQLTPTVGDRKMAGAARKSASITCSRSRQAKHRRSSSDEEEVNASSGAEDCSNASEDDNNKASTSEEEDDGNSEMETKRNNKKSTPVLKSKDKPGSKKSKKAPIPKTTRTSNKFNKKSDYSDEEDEQSEDESDNEKERDPASDEDEDEEVEQEDSDDDELVEIKPDMKKLKCKTVSNSTSKGKKTNKKGLIALTKKEIKRERSSSLSSARSSSGRRFERQESVETEECKFSPHSRLSRSRSVSGESDPNNTLVQMDEVVESSSSSSSEEDGDDIAEGGTEESTDSDDEDSEQLTPEKVDVSTQVDMDEVEGLPTSSVSLAELAGLVVSKKEDPPPPPKDDSDDDVQEIGQVFASASTSLGSTPRHRGQDKVKSSTSSGHSARTQGAGLTPPSSSPFHHQHPTPPPFQHPPQQMPHFHPPTIEPIQHPPFNHFMPPPPPTIQPDFYTPLQLGPPMVHSSIQLVGSSLGGIVPSPFPNIATNPLNTLSIPVSVPFSSHHHLLPHHFATGSTFHSTTLQTHIRSVATNLDIPLVRPMVDHHHQQHSSSYNLIGRGPSIGLSSNAPLTRPPISLGMGMGGVGGIWGQPQSQTIDPNRGGSATSRNPYSAFRVPHLSSATATHTTHTTQHVIHHQSTTVLGMNNSTPVLPVSIIQPQTHHQHYHHQNNQHNVQSQQPGSSHHSQHQQSHTSKSKASNKGGNQHHTNTKQKQSTSNSVSANAPASSSSTSQRPKSPSPPGYHLIKHLPNVSIVPKFDRNSIQEAGSSTTKKKGNTKNLINNDEKNEPGEKKKAGRKKKDSAVLPHPSSPLTVRKDSSNPSTYAPKKQGKSDSEDKKKNSSASSSFEQQSGMASTSTKSPQQKPPSGGRDEFGKLLRKKGSTTGSNKNSASPAPDSQPNINTNFTDIASERNKSESPKTHKIKNNNKDGEWGSSSSSKSHQSSSSRTSSPSVQSKFNKSPEEASSSRTSIRNGISDAPTYHPSDKEFEDPLKYIQKIQAQAEKYGMARIVPPKSFRPECNVEDDMRFTAYNHYIHKMYQRWGPNVLESECIKQNLKQSQVDVSEVPVIGGMEINLSTLYQTVKSFGGLKEVIEKQRWTKVSDSMHVPKAAHDRAAKLDAIYLKYVLPYDILSDGEREKLKKKVEKKWTKRKDKILKAAENCNDDELDEDSMDELDECIVKGKTTPLSSYYRVARNTLNIFFPTEKEHSCDEIEEEYWKIVRERNQPVCVYSGSIDCAGVGWGFPIPKASNKHPWNLKVLANNQGSVLRSMGPVMGATVPTLHVAMLFTSYCWYRDPHSLPWVEYLHSGANKIWYSVPSAHESSFRSTLTELMPMQCKKKQIWLASDSAMVPPEMLAKGVPLVRAVQNPGEFLVVFPKAYTSAICTGYLISESVCFAYPSWLQSCIQTFKDINESKEPPVFPLEKLLLSILQDARASLDVVRSILPATKQLIQEEIALRKKIISLGVKMGGKITTESESGTKNASKKKKKAREEEIEQCYNCNYTLYLSMVRNLKTDLVMCIKHALEYFAKHKADIKKSNLLFDLDESHLDTILENAIKRCGNVPRSPDKS